MIRQFERGDALECHKLIQACLETDTSYSPGLIEKLRNSETPRNITERAGLFYVAVYESEGRILGLAGLDMNEVRLLYVLPGHQRRGIGRLLLDHLLGMVPRALFRDVFVYSTMQSVDFYRACGFRDRGPYTFDLQGNSLRTVFMTCPLLPVAPHKIS